MEENTKPNDILPYPWQADNNEYPEWEKYGEVFTEIQLRDHTAKEYMEVYKKFYSYIQQLRQRVIKALGEHEDIYKDDGKDIMTKTIRNDLRFEIEQRIEAVFEKV